MKLDKILVYFIYLVLNHLLHYRSKVIERNLKIISPNLNQLEINIQKSKFYKHLANLFLESIWAFQASKEDILKKVKIKNPELLEQIFQSGNHVCLLLSHIGNWELFCQWSQVRFPEFKINILYTPLKNNAINQLMIQWRERFGARMVSTKSTLELFRIQKEKEVSVNLFAIDQNPGDPYHQHWLDFFGEKVPVISGAEKFARSQNQKAYYIYVRKMDTYELELIEINYDQTVDYDLTIKQFELLEQNIKENPSLWLLSHNRFKYRKFDD